MILLIANIYTVYDRFQTTGNSTIDFDETYQLGFLLGYFQYIIDIIFVYKYGRQHAINYFFTYDYIDNIIGMAYCKNIRKDIKNISWFFFTTTIITYMAEYLAYAMNCGWTLSLIYLMDYVNLGLRILGNLDTTLNFLQVIYRLKSIGDLIENYYIMENKQEKYINRSTGGIIWTTHEVNNKKLCNIKILSNNRHNIVLWLSRCYLFLNEQTGYINIVYGFRVDIIRIKN